MLKRFFVSFAGSMAAIWLSALLFIVLGVLMVVSIGVAAGGSSEAKISKHSVLYLDLSKSIEERGSSPSITDLIYSQGEAESSAGLDKIVMAIREAANDKDIEGIYIYAGGGTAGLATRFSIVEALKDFKKSGKWILAYGDSYSQGDLLVSSMADSIMLNPQGEVSVAGLAASTPFFKGLLDKIGVEMQVVKVGTFKSAVEPFILEHMSEPAKMQQQAYLDNIWGTIVEQLGAARKVSSDAVNMWADSISSFWSAKQLLTARIVDQLVYEHQADSIVAAKVGKEKFDDVNIVTPEQYCSARSLPKEEGKHIIAVLYAVGDITDDGKEGIVASKIVPEIEDLIDDESIDGLILRVNSGGGSAFASEQIWEALERFKATKRPFYVSMGDVAASGGYYISCGADKIFCQPQTLTGSIGIFGMVPCAKTLVNDKLNVYFTTVSTNPSGVVMGNIAEPLTPAARAALQRRINDGYETFVGRCAQGRGMTIDAIKAIAEGRVWDGKAALENGLVDHLGTLHDCIDMMAAELEVSKYTVKQYPDPTATMLKRMLEMADQMGNDALRAKLGESFDLYRAYDAMLHWEPVQCRMEPVTIL